jgi:hypothetical protein
MESSDTAAPRLHHRRAKFLNFFPGTFLHDESGETPTFLVIPLVNSKPILIMRADFSSPIKDASR